MKPRNIEAFLSRDDVVPYISPYIAPPVNIEMALGITGISQNYELPMGQSPVNFEDTASNIYASCTSTEPQNFTEFLDYAKPILEQIIESNPVLKELQADFENPSHVIDVVRGITSRMNVDDIQWYIENKHNQHVLDVVEAKRAALEEATDTCIEWDPSPTTLDKIRSQAEERGLLKGKEISP